MYDVHVVHGDTGNAIFYGTFSSYGQAESFAEHLVIDTATEHISITLCVVIK